VTTLRWLTANTRAHRSRKFHQLLHVHLAQVPNLALKILETPLHLVGLRYRQRCVGPGYRQLVVGLSKMANLVIQLNELINSEVLKAGLVNGEPWILEIHNHDCPARYRFQTVMTDERAMEIPPFVGADER